LREDLRGAAEREHGRGYAKLRPGPGLAQSEVAADQLRRLRAAMVELVDKCGYRPLTVRQLCRLAGVSTSTFYGFFADKEACLTHTYGATVRAAMLRLRGALGPAPAEDPRERLLLAFQALLEAVDANPAAARMALLEAPAAGSEAAASARSWEARFAAVVADCFAAAGPRRPAELFSRAVVAGAAHVLRSRLLGGEPLDRRELAGELADWAYACGGRATAAAASLDPRGGAEPSRSAPAPICEELPLGDERALILSAASSLAVEDGYEALSVSRVRAAAGVSRRCFESHFDSLDDCFLAVCAAVARGAFAGAAREAAAERNWLAGLRRALQALFAQMAREPARARLVLLEVDAPGREGIRVRSGLVADAAAQLLEAVGIDPDEAALPVQASLAAVWEVAAKHLAEGRLRQLYDLAPVLTLLLAASLKGAPAASGRARAEGPGARRRIAAGAGV
jgi:AcrR family transcriptional regulator